VTQTVHRNHVSVCRRRTDVGWGRDAG